MNASTAKDRIGYATPGILEQIVQTIVAAVALTILLELCIDSGSVGLGKIVLVVLIVQVLQTVAQPLFSLIAKLFGIFGILFLSLFAYALVLWGAFELVPGLEQISFGTTVVIAWIYAALMTSLQWVFLARSDRYFLHTAIKAARKKPKRKTTVPGFLFVQLDGIPWQLLDWQIKAGNLPNVKRLLEQEGYVVKKWRTQIPSTTPASQAGILLGSNDGIPAFRWYERASERLVVANQPADASLIESRLSNGKGLLVDGGVSVGNIFSGDAPSNIMVLSRLEGDRQSLKAMHEYSAYFSNLYGFMRVFVLAIGEMLKELYQGRRQRLRGIRPRIDRHGSYVVLRAATNVILRDLQTTIVLDQMMQGVNSIYVDYLDYDEIAHHAGIARPESLAAVTGLDRVIGVLTEAARHAPRPYHVVFVSDHGQSQGETFKQLTGKGLDQVVGELLRTNRVLGLTDPVEMERTPRALLAEGSAGQGVKSDTLAAAARKYEKGKQVDTAESEVVVTGSGNLGNIWIRSYQERPTRKDIDQDYPRLIDALLATKGIGLVLVDSGAGGPVCIGADGEISLRSGKIVGANPLTPYAKVTAAQLLKLATMKNAPDLQVISSYDESTGEVHAFEELVGSHGGIGGWQTDALLLHPEQLKISKRHLTDGELVDSVNVHRVFIDWLKQAGHRQSK